MGRALKWIGIVVGGLLGLVVVLALVLHLLGRSRLANAPDAQTVAVTVPTNAAAVARGERLAHTISECIGCHTDNLGGQVFVDEAPIGYLPAPNLTSGAGGIGANLTDADWERAIRHGVGHDGRTLVVMPSNWYTNLSDEDVGALIAYLKQLPPVDNELGARRIAFPGTILLGVLGYNTLPVATIDHANAGMSKPPEEPTAAFGEYLVHIAACGECHGANFAGNTDPNGPPMGPNITPGGELQGWTEADFFTAIREGQTPTGRELSPEMPWRAYRHMTDTELSAIWAYLQSLPALPNNE